MSHKEYLKSLPDDQDCRHMRVKALEVCKYPGDCRFKGNLTFSISMGNVPECRRRNVLRFKKILGK